MNLSYRWVMEAWRVWVGNFRVRVGVVVCELRVSER
jgi:hypothetical protein